MISKKDLLKEMNISYGQLYRWKREGLIPDEWFNKQAVSTGQETFFKRNLIIPRIKKILELKDKYQLEELKEFFNPSIEGRKFSLREAIVIEEIDPFILKMYSLKKLSFMPLASVDSQTGVLVTDGAAVNGISNEQFKITVHILSKNLRAD